MAIISQLISLDLSARGGSIVNQHPAKVEASAVLNSVIKCDKEQNIEFLLEYFQVIKCINNTYLCTALL